MAIEAYWSASVATFLATDPASIAGHMAHASQRRFRVNEATQLRAWAVQCAILRDCLEPMPQARSWHLFFEASLPRTDRRADAVLLCGGTIVVLEFKIGADRHTNTDRAQVDDFALDLQDFHAGSHGRRIVPILLPSAATRAPPQQLSLAVDGVQPVVDATLTTLATILDECAAYPAQSLDSIAWQQAPYRPVPPIIEAARALYARHDVEDILDTRAGTHSLATTSGAIRAALARAQAHRRHVILFVTGVPGAGKTLCGLNACFGAADDRLRATFLTGNPSLVHVLREALVRDAVRAGGDRRAAKQRMDGVIQSLPAFRDRYVAHAEIPPEQVVVIDEAQRSWSRDHAIRKSVDRPTPLTDSEPGHLLDAMSRHANWSAIICLIGNGQEIHDGEGGLAEWGAALRRCPTAWDIIAPPDCLVASDPRRRLPPLPLLVTNPDLHLTVPTRQIGHPAAAQWVDAVLEGEAADAASIAADEPGGIPFFLTRDLTALRATLRHLARGSRRAGLVASSGGRRLLAVGLGSELPHMDPGAVARWFLDRYPDDIRASDALELVATEFSVQGLELDVVGLCWDADLIRRPGEIPWQPRSFRGTRWQTTAAPEAISNRINTYRVLLTRARHETVIYVPQGDPIDGTRNPAVLDAIAEFLQSCGARHLPQLAEPNAPAAAPTLFTVTS